MVEMVRVAAVVPWERCVQFAARAFEACGVPADQAHDAAEALVNADGTGTVTHGLKNLRLYVTELKDGRANPTPDIRVVGGSKAGVVMTGDNALGHVAAYAGMRKAIELAKEYGSGTVLVRESNHYGHSGFWASLAVRHNMIGFAVTNATNGIAPFGGKEPLIGNNPPSWAIPTRIVDPNVRLPDAEYQPVFLDMALSTVAGNRLDIYRRRGEPVPAGWALDQDGFPTTSATARNEGGTLTAIAGYKGVGFAVVMSMITSFLGGSPNDWERIDPESRKRKPAHTGHWFQAIDIAQMTDLETFTRSAREARERFQASPPREGVERVYAPGDLENEKARAYQTEGVPLEQFTIDDMSWVAEMLGIEFNLLR
ncbi:MAG: Ldh family oxidoreductase [Chloroflexi bacterium]|nr:Ldh family oxidoreductase [Chloroflexota bacterium]